MSDEKGWRMNVGPGWANLVDQAVKIARNYKLEIRDVHEKDGQLKIVTSGRMSEKPKSLLVLLEVRSTRICEECGKPAKLVKIGRRSVTRCEFHATEEGFYE